MCLITSTVFHALLISFRSKTAISVDFLLSHSRHNIFSFAIVEIINFVELSYRFFSLGSCPYQLSFRFSLYQLTLMEKWVVVGFSFSKIIKNYQKFQFYAFAKFTSNLIILFVGLAPNDLIWWWWLLLVISNRKEASKSFINNFCLSLLDLLRKRWLKQKSVEAGATTKFALVCRLCDLKN